MAKARTKSQNCMLLKRRPDGTILMGITVSPCFVNGSSLADLGAPLPRGRGAPKQRIEFMVA